MDSKRITFCIPSLGSGGAERVVSVLANKLTERGFDVSILMLSHLKCQYRLNDRIKIKCIDCDADMALPMFKRLPLRLRKIKKAAQELQPDCIVSFMAETNIDVCLALWTMKVPIIVSERNDPALDPPSQLKRWLRRIAYWKPCGFVFQTPDAQAYFSRRIRKCSRIILNPLDEHLPMPCTQEEREKRIVAVGRLNKQKRFPLLIDAFSLFTKEYPEYVLEIYGEGALETELRQLIEAQGLQKKIQLKGFCKDVHQRIRTAAMFVMTSDYEGMPNALLEAMAIGVPSISTDCPCGGPRMLIRQGKNGMLVPVGGRDALVKAMSDMAQNPAKAQQMAQEARRMRELADAQTITDAWVEFIDDCLEGRR